MNLNLDGLRRAPGSASSSHTAPSAQTSAASFVIVSVSPSSTIARAAVIVKFSRKIGALVLTAPSCRLRAKLVKAMSANNPASEPHSADKCGSSVPVSQA